MVFETSVFDASREGFLHTALHRFRQSWPDRHRDQTILCLKDGSWEQGIGLQNQKLEQISIIFWHRKGYLCLSERFRRSRSVWSSFGAYFDAFRHSKRSKTSFLSVLDVLEVFRAHLVPVLMHFGTQNDLKRIPKFWFCKPMEQETKFNQSIDQPRKPRAMKTDVSKSGCRNTSDLLNKGVLI